MNKLPLLAALTFALSGCQTMTATPSDPEQANNKHSQLEGASPSDINTALMVNAHYQLLINDTDDNEQAPPVFDDVWERIRYQLSIEVPQNRPVVSERNYYARHQAYLDRISERAQPYLHYIVEEIEKRKMPIEIALLPIVESAFDPFGYSNRSASGIWQFMPQTGERFDLKQNWWYDGRRDIVQSTRAALDYLSYLHKTLGGDWLNAIAAYNSGEGRLLRAIKKNRNKHLPTDFWSLDLPKETTAYVPKLLALADLLKHADDFNVNWEPILNAQVVEVVDVGSQIDLALAADMAQMSLTELYRLNPGFNRWASDPDGPHFLLLPVDKAQPFSQQLAKTDIKQRLRWQQYTVKRGDSLSVIAEKFTTSAGAIKSLNNLDSNTIRVGQTLLVPLSDGDINSAHLPSNVRAAVNTSSRTKKTHKVQSGDTLWDISRKYDVTMEQLANWNKLKKNAVLHLGQKLTVYQSKVHTLSAHSNTQRTITYKVRRGDSLARIASKFNTTVNDIIKWNSLAGQKYLQPGQQLKLKVLVKRS
jgi:membrane-bound lytic murein transglycosylase D